MLNFKFLENGLELVSPPPFLKVSLPDCIYFLRYWAICVLQLFLNQAGTS